MPIIFPPLTVRFQNALSNEETENLKAHGAGIIASKKAADIGYTFAGDQVDFDLLNLLYKHNKKVLRTNPTPVGSVNIKAYQELFRAIGIVTMFLKTQTYPAFVGQVADNDESGGAWDNIEGFVQAKRKGNFGDRGHNKKARVDEAQGDEMEEDPDNADLMGIESLQLGSNESSIPKARPSRQPDNIFGDYTKVPTLPGLIFPYFPEMLESDYNYVTGVVKEYFLECLGETREEILSNYKDFKGAMGSIASTETGKVLQHIFCGISLAIRAQARLFPIVEGRRYLGFTIHGWYFTVSIDGYRHRPMEYATLVDHVRQVDEHAVALAEIFRMLSKLKLTDTNKAMGKTVLQALRSDVANNPRKLAEVIRRFRIDDHTIAEEIEKCCSRLSYPQRFWPYTVENILRAVDFLVADSFPPVDTPMFPRGGTITSRSPAIAIFALFGESGFSFKTAGGKPLKIAADLTGDTVLKPYKGKNQKEVKPNPTFILSKKSLGLCVEDWKVFLVDHLFLNKETRDSAFRSIRFGGPYGGLFWKGLIERVGPLKVAEASTSVKPSQVELGDDMISDGGDDLNDFL